MKTKPIERELTHLEIVFNNIYECALSGKPDRQTLQNDYLTATQRIINKALKQEREKAINIVKNKRKELAEMCYPIDSIYYFLDDIINSLQTDKEERE